MLRQLFDVLEQSVTVRDRDGELVFANRAALEQMGVPSLEALRAQGAVIPDPMVLLHEDDTPLTPEDLPAMRILRGEECPPMLVRVGLRGGGDPRWSILRATPIIDPDGTLAGVITVIEDNNEVKLAQIQTDVLAESGRVLVSTLDYQQTLTNVVGLAVPALVDFCGVDLVDDLGRIQRMAAAYRGPEHKAISDRLRDLDPFFAAANHPAARVIESQAPLLFSEADTDELAAAARGDAHLDLLRDMGVRSLIMAPMTVPNRAIGVMSFGTLRGGRALGAQDVAVFEQLARRAGVAVENARLHTKLRGVAETVQRSLLPRPLPNIPAWEMAALYEPAETELRVDVGGDFYEFFQHEDTWFAIFGDVAGRGVEASSVTALMRHGARVASRAEPEPAAILARLDEALADQPGDTLATALCLCLHPDHIVISSAGHPPALIVSPDGELREAPTPGPLLGAFPGSARPEERVDLEPGELMLFYTDGVTEAQGAEDRFGNERLADILREHAGAAPEELLAALKRRLDDFLVAPARDDVAAVALRVRGR